MADSEIPPKTEKPASPKKAAEVTVPEQSLTDKLTVLARNAFTLIRVNDADGNAIKWGVFVPGSAVGGPDRKYEIGYDSFMAGVSGTAASTSVADLTEDEWESL
jgi:hypothetical protein